MIIPKGPYKNFKYRNQLWNTREDGTLDISNLPSGEPHRTQQQFKDQCDINNILKSYQETGTINHLNPNKALFTEFMEIPTHDFLDAMNIVAYAKSSFEQLPAHVRSRFENDPAKLVEFCNNPNNLDEAIKLGLAIQPPPQELPQNANSNANPPKAPKIKVPKPLQPTSESESSDS